MNVTGASQNFNAESLGLINTVRQGYELPYIVVVST